MHAHGGGFLVENGLYHWFGTSVKKDNGLSRGINLVQCCCLDVVVTLECSDRCLSLPHTCSQYTSRDLQHWTFVRMVFTNTSIVASQPGPYRIERPKVIYNELTQKFVMWCARRFFGCDEQYVAESLTRCRASTKSGSTWTRVVSLFGLWLSQSVTRLMVTTPSWLASAQTASNLTTCLCSRCAAWPPISDGGTVSALCVVGSNTVYEIVADTGYGWRRLPCTKRREQVCRD